MKQCAIDASYTKLGCVPRDITYPHAKELCPKMPEFGKNSFLLRLLLSIQEKHVKYLKFF